MTPTTFIPRAACDFVGPAAKLARLLTVKAQSAGGSKLLLFGQPGVGKTTLANMFAGLIAGHSSSIESLNGRNVNIDVIRRWQDAAQYRPLAGGLTVKIVNELEKTTEAAQDLLLTYLDDAGLERVRGDI